MNTFTLHGLTFGWETHDDDHMNEPWVEHDGHGVIRDTGRAGPSDKRAGELVMGRWHYNLPASIAKAKAEGWGLSEPMHLQLAEQLGRVPTKREVIVAAVQDDYLRMKAWADDEWGWIYVMCYLLDADGNRTPLRDSLSGIESDNETYHAEVAVELAEQILHGRGDPEELREVTVGAVTYRVRGEP